MIDGKPAQLGVSGTLWKDALVMYDDVTGSMWSQVDGRAIVGPQRGARLRELPAVQTTWAEWVRLHPDTRVLRKQGAARAGSRYEAYFKDPGRLGVLGSKARDTRLPPKEVVIGLVLGGEARAYPRSRLRAGAVVNDVVGGVPVLLAIHPSSGRVDVFKRAVAGRTLSFGAGAADSVKVQGGGELDLRNGRISGGAEHGAVLERLAISQPFWFSWVAFHPKSSFWPGEERR